MQIRNKFVSFSSLFQDVAEKHHADKAVIFDNRSLNYKELDTLSTAFAKRLITRGVKRGDVVALGMYNDLDLLIALLAIWKANAVYLPVDPNYPTERVAAMCRDASPTLLITKQALKHTFSFFDGKIQFIEEIKRSDVEAVVLEPNQPSDLAYIMYTSGSTGKPKGVMVDQRALTHAALAYKELHREKPLSLVCGSISFDPSLLTIIHALLLGGTLCLYDNRTGIDLKNANEIVEIVNEQKVNFLLTTPSFYATLLQVEKPLFSLRNVDLCGEVITIELIEKHREIAPHAFLYNVYGPTEYAMGSTATVIFDRDTKKVSKMSIGKPFASNKVYILDENLCEVKEAEKGEIVVGGPGLSRGYKNLEGLNKEKFIELTLDEKPPLRLYRTGDLGYYLPDGNIVFVGRKDLQVKIKGHRVELQEIEHVIDTYKGVKKGIVTANIDTREENQLIAFFSATGDVTKEKLHAYLRKKLPSYMLPIQYVKVDKWPTLENGKVDRKALCSLIKN